MKVARLSALRTGRLYPPGKTPGTHFCCRLSRPQGHSATGRITSMKNPNDRIGNRTRSASTNCATTYPVRRWWVVKCIPRPPHPRKRDPIPIVQEAGWAPGPILRKISPPRGFHLRTVQPVASRCTNIFLLQLFHEHQTDAPVILRLSLASDRPASPLTALCRFNLTPRHEIMRKILLRFCFWYRQTPCVKAKSK